VHTALHNKKHKKSKNKNKELHPDLLEPMKDEGASKKSMTFNQRCKYVFDQAIPWILLIGFTALNVASTALANYGLTLTPTSIFVVCKTTKIIFVAALSVVFGLTRLIAAQWGAMFVLSCGLLVAVFGDKGVKSKASSDDFSILGPILLIASELLHALMLISQQIAVERYWPEPAAIVTWGAVVGIPLTLLSMYSAAGHFQSAAPQEPINDFSDVFVMCSNSWELSVALIANMFFHVGMDLSHMVCLKYMSGLAKSFADAIKLAVMWLAGKAFWFLGRAIWRSAFPGVGGTLAVLAEPPTPMWYLMIPALFLIAHSLLMFKYRNWIPLVLERVPEAASTCNPLGLVLGIKESPALDENSCSLDTGLDDTFYTAAFHNHKIRKRLKLLWKEKRGIAELQQEKEVIRKSMAVNQGRKGLDRFKIAVLDVEIKNQERKETLEAGALERTIAAETPE
jgi:hypothetical protein